MIHNSSVGMELHRSNLRESWHIYEQATIFRIHVVHNFEELSNPFWKWTLDGLSVTNSRFNLMLRKCLIPRFSLRPDSKITGAFGHGLNLLSDLWSRMEALRVHDHGHCDLLLVFVALAWNLAWLLHLSRLRNDSGCQLFFILLLNLVVHESSLVILFHLGNILLKGNKHFLMVGRQWFKVYESVDHVGVRGVRDIDWKVGAV